MLKTYELDVSEGIEECPLFLPSRYRIVILLFWVTSLKPTMPLRVGIELSALYSMLIILVSGVSSMA
jgi:hypothetical protein